MFHQFFQENGELAEMQSLVPFHNLKSFFCFSPWLPLLTFLLHALGALVIQSRDLDYIPSESFLLNSPEFQKCVSIYHVAH